MNDKPEMQWLHIHIEYNIFYTYNVNTSENKYIVYARRVRRTVYPIA